MTWSNAVEAAFLTQLTTAGTFGSGGDQITLTGDIYVGLSTADPLEDNSGIAEVNTADGYAREQVTLGAVTEGADAATRASTTAMQHGPATADWGLITHLALFDAVTAGNFLGSGPLDNDRTVLSGDTFDWAIGQLSVSLT